MSIYLFAIFKVAEGNTEDADALATYALCCIQLRSDHKQYSAPPVPDKAVPAKELSEKKPVARTTFLSYFGVGKEKAAETKEIIKKNLDNVGLDNSSQHSKLSDISDADHDKQSTVVTMRTVPIGTESVFEGPEVDCNKSTKGMEILALIEVIAGKINDMTLNDIIQLILIFMILIVIWYPNR